MKIMKKKTLVSFLALAACVAASSSAYSAPKVAGRPVGAAWATRPSEEAPYALTGAASEIHEGRAAESSRVRGSHEHRPGIGHAPTPR